MFLLIGGTSFFVQPSLAQVAFTVKDKESQKPIEYAQIALLRINQGASTDSNGHFTLDNYLFADIILISALGYRNIKITAKTLVASPVVYLNKEPFALAEVVVSAKRDKSKLYKKRLGWYDDKLSTLLNLDRLCPKKGSRTVVWIENSLHVGGTVDELIIRFLPKIANADSKPVLVRVCALSGNRTSGPEQDISIIPTAFIVKPKSQTTHILLKDKQLYLPPTGGFIGIEWIGNDSENIPICLGLTKSDARDNNKPGDTWQSYRGKMWSQFGTGYGPSKRLQTFTNANARIDVIVSFPR